MYNNIDLDKIDISGPPPTTEPDRQYYFMAKCRQIVKKKSAELGRPLFCHTKTFGRGKNEQEIKRKIMGVFPSSDIGSGSNCLFSAASPDRISFFYV